MFLRPLLLCLATGLSAAPPTPQATSSPEAHKRLAKEVYLLVGGAGTATTAAEAMIGTLQKEIPMNDQVRGVVMNWCNHVFSSQGFEEDITQLYVQTFTERELQELVQFYKSDLGRRLVTSMPKLMNQGAAIGARHAEKHQPLLQQMLADTLK